ncbi:MAG: hypothetical protein ACTSPB_00095 [Candidatus Thorarchaeota archaeon]
MSDKELSVWEKKLTSEEIFEARYVHGTCAIEGNTLTLADVCEILYGDKRKIKEKYGVI